MKGHLSYVLDKYDSQLLKSWMEEADMRNQLDTEKMVEKSRKKEQQTERRVDRIMANWAKNKIVETEDQFVSRITGMMNAALYREDVISI